MKPGKVVTLVDAAGQAHVATVTAVVGTGGSGCKRLDLAGEGGPWANVAFDGDEAAGEPFWIFPVVVEASAPVPVAEPDHELHESHE